MLHYWKVKLNKTTIIINKPTIQTEEELICANMKETQILEYSVSCIVNDFDRKH